MMVPRLVFTPLLLAFTTLRAVLAQDLVGGAFEGMANSDEPVQIQADRLKVIDKDNTAILTGNVNVVQGTTIIKAGKITVYYDKDKTRKTNQSQGGRSIHRIIATGGRVAVKSGDNRATSDKAVVNMRTETVTMTGDVVVSQGLNVANGCFLKVNFRTSVSEFRGCDRDGGKDEGRPTLIFQP